MRNHFAWALPSSAILAFLETTVAVAVSFALSGPLGYRTGASLDPERVIAGLVEITSADQLVSLMKASAIGLALLGSFVVLEPFLFVLFVRNHETHSRRGPMSLERRALRIVGLRLFVLFAIAVLGAIAYGIGTAAYVTLDHLRDPRPRDLALALLGLVTSGLTITAHLTTELAAIRLAIRKDTILEALLEGYRALDRRTLLVRVLTFAGSTALALAAALSPESLVPAIALTALTISLRVLLRSAFIADVVSRLPR